MTNTVSPIRIALRQARKVAKLTQVELAELAEVRPATISDIEKGKTTRIDLAVIERLCRVLNVTPGRLIRLDPALKPPQERS